MVNETISTKYTATGGTISGEFKLEVKRGGLSSSHEVGEN